MSTFLRY